MLTGELGSTSSLPAMNDRPTPRRRFTPCPPGRRLFLYGLAALCAIGSLFVANAAHAAVIAFNSYPDGNLGATSDWENTSGTPTTHFVVSSAGLAVDYTATTGRSTVYQTPYDFTTLEPYTMSIDFRFSNDLVTAAGSTTFIQLAYFTGSNSGTVSGVGAGIGRNTSANGYRLAFANGAVNIAGTDLGIDVANDDLDSDLIRMTLTLQQGATASTWIGTETIYNVTTGQLLATRSSSVINVGAAHGDNSFYAGFSQGTGFNTSGITSLTVLNFSTPAVPEPGAPMLLAGMGTIFLLVRRRRDR